KDRLIAFLQSFGAIQGKADGYKYAGTDRRGYAVEPGAGAEKGTVLGPVPSLSDVLASGVGQRFSFELGYDQAMMMFQPVGGMDAIPKALERAVGAHKITYEAAATGFANVPGGVEVSWKDKRGREHVERADFCVVATPPHIAARLRHNLGDAVGNALRTPVPVSVGKIGLEYRSRWWELQDHMYGGVVPTDTDLSNMWFPSYGFQGRRGTVIGYYNVGPNAEVYGRLAPDDRTRRAVDQGVKIFGDRYRTELDSAFSVAWHRTPGLEAGWVGWPNQDGPEYKLLNEPQGNVYFAGDWLSHVIAWQHGAFTSARKVVTTLHQRVMAA
ncbi:MAG: amino acid oxidase, partial [Streptomycetaceae bacterium]|nr:amino acid oxidase [Streptomycetaceae bacterium]